MNQTGRHCDHIKAVYDSRIASRERGETMHRAMLFLLGIAVAFSLTAMPTPAPAQGRVALVIGNDKYPNLPANEQLLKAVNDARAVGDALRKLGFTVISGENLNRAEMVNRVFAFMQSIKPGDIAVMFYAGHGVTVSGGNYLLPTDIPQLNDGEEARARNLALGEADIIADIQDKKARVTVLFLDACRNNPFRRPGLTRGVGGERGLARGREAEGVFSVYSAGFGQLALDRLEPNDASPNSVFTRVLIPQLARKDVHLGDMIIDVREEVAKLAAGIGHQQYPAYYDQTRGGRIYLAGRSIAVDPKPDAPLKADTQQQPEPQQKPAPGQTSELAELVAKVNELVVTVISTGLAPAQDDKKGESKPKRTGGSGFVVDPSGLILTVDYVLEHKDIEVTFSDGSKSKAALVGQDKLSGVALIKVERPTPLKPVTFGNSDSVRTGDRVLTISYRSGQRNAPATGTVSNPASEVLKTSGLKHIETDIAYLGMAGAPLFNMAGEVVGMSFGIISRGGGDVGLSVPARPLRSYIEHLRNFGEVRRRHIGVNVSNATKDAAEQAGLKETAGALVASVAEGSTAKQAGIQPGDIIVKAGGKPVKTTTDLVLQIADTPVGRSIELTIMRKRLELRAMVKVADSTPSAPPQTAANPGGESSSSFDRFFKEFFPPPDAGSAKSGDAAR